MLPFFDFLRRWTRDSILAGAYDAAEVLQNQPVEEPLPSPPNSSTKPSEQPVEKIEPPRRISPPPSQPNPALFPASESLPPLPPRRRGRPRKNPPGTNP